MKLTRSEAGKLGWVKAKEGFECHVLRRPEVVKKAAKKAAPKKTVARRPLVEIDNPTSPEASERAFGISSQRSRDIQRLVDEALA